MGVGWPLNTENINATTAPEIAPNATMASRFHPVKRPYVLSADEGWLDMVFHRKYTITTILMLRYYGRGVACTSLFNRNMLY